jgi:hypothetical protein
VIYVDKACDFGCIGFNHLPKDRNDQNHSSLFLDLLLVFHSKPHTCLVDNFLATILLERTYSFYDFYACAQYLDISTDQMLIWKLKVHYQVYKSFPLISYPEQGSELHCRK